VGQDVEDFQEGALVAVGCMVDSCQKCTSCEEGVEQYCLNGFTGTYNGKDKYLGGRTYGGYSKKIVVDQKFVLKVPENLDLAGAAPLLCAGVTTWSPLKYYNINQDSKVAVIGLGGLGHMAIKLASALGAEVTLFSRSPEKREDAISLGASDVIISTKEDEMKKVNNAFDLIIDTVPYQHDINPYVPTLKIGGTLVLVGLIGDIEPTLSTVQLVVKRKAIAGSLIGSIKETQELLDFCGKHNIVSETETIKMEDINEAYERMINSDVRYRFVIDMSSLPD
jgi:uncharacterized zinc-type alcohol dehydrogenase-like protein